MALILTITYEGQNTQDLGYLLYKNPYRAQSFDLPTGKAHVVYPEISDERTTAALILDLDPLILSKGKPGTGEAGLFDYVNDRPYVSSSFMSGAIKKVFATAMTGRCVQRQELADARIDLTVKLFMLPVRGEKDMINRFFAPLGYTVSFETFPIDEDFPEWGESPYVNLCLKGRVRLADLLNQIYILIPVFDLQRHYYAGEDEIENVIRHGNNWLSTHPERDYILKRYFNKSRNYAKEAISRLDSIYSDSEKPFIEEIGLKSSAEDIEKSTENTNGETTPSEIRQYSGEPLDKIRIQTVCNTVISCEAKTVIDIGCGEGKLLALLAKEPQIQKIAGVDVSVSALKKARLRLENLLFSDSQRQKVTLFQGSLMYRDKRYKGYDALCLVEVLEHIDPKKLPVLEKNIFGYTSPNIAVITTPNRAYNVNYDYLTGAFRHKDHRFEWDEKEYRAWCEKICEEYGYGFELSGIGRDIEIVNAASLCPTMMAVFRKIKSN